MTLAVVSDVDQRFADIVRRYVDLVGHRLGTVPRQWPGSPNFRGVVVLLQDVDDGPWRVWAGPIAPDGRIAEHNFRGHVREHLYLAVFASCADAWRAYRAYINDRAGAGLRLPAVMRLHTLDHAKGIQLLSEDTRSSLPIAAMEGGVECGRIRSSGP